MGKTYALFDFDGTIIRGDSLSLLCLYARQKRLMSIGSLLGSAAMALLCSVGLCSSVRAKKNALRFLNALPMEKVEEIVVDFCRTTLRPRIRAEARKAIARHHDAGDTLLLVSASPDFYLKPLAKELKFDALIATRLEPEADGTFCSALLGENCRGVQKVMRLAEYLAGKGEQLDYEGSTAYGDSYHDLPMMHLCLNKVCVNPSRRLRRAMRSQENAVCVCWEEPLPDKRDEGSGD